MKRNFFIIFAVVGLFSAGIIGLSFSRAKDVSVSTDSSAVNSSVSLSQPVADASGDVNFDDAEVVLAELDPLFEGGKDYGSEDVVEFEQRQFAVVTAHMSDDQLIVFLDLRNNSVVRDMNGVLNTSYSYRSTCGDLGFAGDCIVHSETKKIIFNGKWNAGFVPTGIGMEVVKLK